MTTWLDSAVRIIRDGMKDIPADTPIKERKRLVRALRPAAYSQTSWGRKVWPKAVKVYLAPFIKSDACIPVNHLSPLERLMRKGRA